MWTLFSIPSGREFRARLTSGAGLFHLICWSVNLLIPLVIIYRGESGLWDKIHYYYEQPSVRFQHEYLLVVELYDSPQSLIATSNGNLINGMLDIGLDEDSLRPAVIDHREIDHNNDGVPDEFESVMEMPLREDSKGRREHVKGFRLLMFFHHEAKQRIKLAMESVVFHESMRPYDSVQLSHGEVFMVGDYKLKQKHPLPIKENLPFIASNLMNEDETMRGLNGLLSHGTLSDSLQSYFTQNVTSSLQLKLIQWKKIQDLSITNFRISLRMNIPLDRIEYESEFWHLLIWAWVQYLAIFIVLYYVIYKIREIVFAHNLLGCHPIHKPDIIPSHRNIGRMSSIQKISH